MAFDHGSLLLRVGLKMKVAGRGAYFFLRILEPYAVAQA
jgi:hypothetical protein